MLKRINHISRCTMPLGGAGIAAHGDPAVESTIRLELPGGD